MIIGLFQPQREERGRGSTINWTITIFVEERQQLMWELVAQVDEIWGSRGNMKLQISIGRAFT